MSAMNDRVFELNGVSRSFGQVKAVENLTLSLGKGEVTGFLGTNGAGKTTTITTARAAAPRRSLS